MEDATQALWDEELFITPQAEPLPAGRKAGRLIVHAGPGDSVEHPLYAGITFLGRESGDDAEQAARVQAWQADADCPSVHGLMLPGPGLSKSHASIEMDGSGQLWFLTDLGSTNGSHILHGSCSVRCQPNVKYGMASGQSVRFGNVRCTVMATAASGGDTQKGQRGEQQTAPGNEEAAGAEEDDLTQPMDEEDGDTQLAGATVPESPGAEELPGSKAEVGGHPEYSGIEPQGAADQPEAKGAGAKQPAEEAQVDSGSDDNKGWKRKPRRPSGAREPREGADAAALDPELEATAAEVRQQILSSMPGTQGGPLLVARHAAAVGPATCARAALPGKAGSSGGWKVKGHGADQPRDSEEAQATAPAESPQPGHSPIPPTEAQGKPAAGGESSEDTVPPGNIKADTPGVSSATEPPVGASPIEAGPEEESKPAGISTAPPEDTGPGSEVPGTVPNVQTVASLVEPVDTAAVEGASQELDGQPLMGQGPLGDAGKEPAGLHLEGSKGAAGEVECPVAAAPGLETDEGRGQEEGAEEKREASEPAPDGPGAEVDGPGGQQSPAVAGSRRPRRPPQASRPARDRRPKKPNRRGRDTQSTIETLRNLQKGLIMETQDIAGAVAPPGWADPPEEIAEEDSGVSGGDSDGDGSALEDGDGVQVETSLEEAKEEGAPKGRDDQKPPDEEDGRAEDAKAQEDVARTAEGTGAVLGEVVELEPLADVGDNAMEAAPPEREAVRPSESSPREPADALHGTARADDGAVEDPSESPATAHVADGATDDTTGDVKAEASEMVEKDEDGQAVSQQQPEAEVQGALTGALEGATSPSDVSRHSAGSAVRAKAKPTDVKIKEEPSPAEGTPEGSEAAPVPLSEATGTQDSSQRATRRKRSLGHGTPVASQSQLQLQAVKAEPSRKRARRSAVKAEPSQAATSTNCPASGGANCSFRLHFSTCIGPSLLKKYTATAQSLGAEVCSAGDDTFTHYVTMEGKAEDGMGFIRSFKTLLALASGLPIVNHNWLEACKLQGCFVPIESFLLKDREAEKAHSFSISASYRRAQEHLVFEGLSIFFTPSLLKKEKDGGRNIRALALAGGATLEGNIPEQCLRAGLSKAARLSEVLIVADKADRSWSSSKLRKGLPVHSRDHFITAIMQQERPAKNKASCMWIT